VSYVFDNSPLSALFRNYYRKTFPTLWGHFDQLVADGRLVSTREAFREIEDGPIESLIEWAKANRSLFAMPTPEEGAFVARIYGVSRFQQNIEQKKLLRGGKVADPFVIARAARENRTVVTVEVMKPNAVKIPNICAHFGVKCLSLAEFMEAEGWTF
jgi:Domain of unknown function (DUF4411)